MLWQKAIKLLEELRMSKDYQVLDHLEGRDEQKDAEFDA